MNGFFMKKLITLYGLFSCTIIFGNNPNVQEILQFYTKMQSAINTEKSIIATKLLTLNSIENAFNSSIIEKDDGYLLIFRHDTNEK